MSHQLIHNGKTTTGRGTDADIRLGDRRKSWTNKTVTITGITTGTVRLVVSADGVTYVDYPGMTALTADGAWLVETPYQYLNVDITVATTVAIIATVL